jgi:DNA repair protein RadD
VRSDNNGLGDIWEEIVFKRNIGWAVKHGFLVQPRGIQLGGELDLTNVRTTTTGDYNDNDLESVVMIEDLRDAVVKGYHAITPGRSAVLFAPTQVSARFFGEALSESGVRVAEIFASTKPAMRKWAFHGFETGAIQVLVTCTALAEGWDSPRCDTALMVRPTKHAGLFIQQVGRVLRPWPFKECAYILDFVGLLDDKDLNAAIDLNTTPEKEELDPDLEECDECGEYRILRYISKLQMNLCAMCIKVLDIEPEHREHTVRKIDGITEIDILASSTARWLQTDFGMPFIMTSDKAQCGRARIFFLAHIDGMYNAGVTHSAKNFNGGQWLVERVDAEEAADVASNAALEDDPTIVHRGASWRKKVQSPSAGQLAYAADLGVDTSGLNMAQVADAITIKIASRTLGSVYRKMYLDMQKEMTTV